MIRPLFLISMMFLLLGCTKAHTDAAKPVDPIPQCTGAMVDSGKSYMCSHPDGTVTIFTAKSDKAAVPEAPKDEKFDTVDWAFVDSHSCHEVYHSEERPSSPAYSLYRCAGMQDDVEVDLPPATHHPSLPTPKPDRRRKRKPHWTSDAAQMPLVVQQQPPTASDEGQEVWGLRQAPKHDLHCPAGTHQVTEDAGADESHTYCKDNPVVTPQQFTDFMNKSFPKYSEPIQLSTHSDYVTDSGEHRSIGCPVGTQMSWDVDGKPAGSETKWIARCYTDGLYLPKCEGCTKIEFSGAPSYPPEYKMPRGEQ